MTSLQALRAVKERLNAKSSRSLSPGLLRLKSCELFGIAYAELNLEADAVKIDDLFRSHVGVGGEVQERLSVFNRTDHDTSARGRGIRYCQIPQI